MRTLRFSTTVALAVAAMCASVTARAEVIEYGTGQVDCSVYLSTRANRDPNDDRQVTQWTYGFLSGYNTFAKPQLQLELPQDAILQFFDHYCRSNPTMKLGAGVFVLIEQVGGPKAGVPYKW